MEFMLVITRSAAAQSSILLVRAEFLTPEPFTLCIP